MPVFDQGYQHWTGTPSGHAGRWLTVARHGVRVGMKNIFLRLVVVVSWLPAVALAFVLCVWGLLEQDSPLIAPVKAFLTPILPAEMLKDPRSFRVEIWTVCFQYFLAFELRFAMIVVLLVGPGLISQDLRFNALPLYFSRPLRRADYFAGKLGVIAWFLGLVIVLPSLIAYALGLLFSLDVTILWDTAPLLLACLAYGAVIVLSAGTLMLALSSLTRNSRYVALFWVALWFVSGIVGFVLGKVDEEQRRHAQYRRQAELTAEQMPPREAARRAHEEARAQELRDAPTNWWPLVSYTANLSRVGQQMLNTDAAWRRLSGLAPAEFRDQFLLANLGPQYPWPWSAGVLAVLFGISAWILHTRVRSLDRLR